MIGRATVIFSVLAATMGAGQAADLAGGSPAGSVNCGPEMITIYDSRPGVVTRRWQSGCTSCDQADHRRGFGRAAATVVVQQYTPFMDPWRR